MQYMAALYKDCMLDYLHSYRIKEWPKNVRNSRTIQDSMRNGRKVFRLLRWIEEIGSLDKNLKKATNTLSVLKFARHLIGIFYYIFDNIVWISEAGIINKYISDPRWKWENSKNVLSLMRYSLLFFIVLLKVRKIFNKETACADALVRRKLMIRQGNEGYGLMQAMFKIRYKRRYSVLSMMKNLLRIFMLYKTIKLPGSGRISMICIDACGIISYALGVAKLLALQNKPQQNKKKMGQCFSQESVLSSS